MDNLGGVWIIKESNSGMTDGVILTPRQPADASTRTANSGLNPDRWFMNRGMTEQFTVLTLAVLSASQAPAAGETATASRIPGGSSSESFSPPFSGDAVLYLVDTVGHG